MASCGPGEDIGGEQDAGGLPPGFCGMTGLPVSRALPLNRRGALLGLGAIAGVAVFSRALSAAPEAGLEAGETETITSVADTIIPRTDTAGAIGAGVVPFIALIVTAWMDEGQRTAFRDGLKRFDMQARRDLGGAFADQPQARREAYLTTMLGKAQASIPSIAPGGHAPFLVWMKRLTLHGYYTSEIGASQELELNLIPGGYEGCHHMAPGDRSFSLDRRQTPMVIDLQGYQPK
jgi:hypothetical protein